MCTLAIFFCVLPGLPLLAAANRDEHYDRPSESPRELGAEPKMIAGRDLRAGGTWLGVNEHGVLAAMLNRRINGESDALARPRSRGLLCMDLLKQPSARDSVSWLAEHRADYDPFAALVVDRNDAHVAYNAGRQMVTQKLDPGLHVFSSAAEFDLHSSKADRAYELFGALGQRLSADQSARAELVSALRGVLADHSLPTESKDPGDAICVHRETAGTVSSSIALLSLSASRFEFFHCPGAPCRDDFGPALELPIR